TCLLLLAIVAGVVLVRQTLQGPVLGTVSAPLLVTNTCPVAASTATLLGVCPSATVRTTRRWMSPRRNVAGHHRAGGQGTAGHGGGGGPGAPPWRRAQEDGGQRSQCAGCSGAVGGAQRTRRPAVALALDVQGGAQAGRGAGSEGPSGQ